MTADAVVFDFDGVLADSEPLHLRVYQELLAAENITLPPADTTRATWATTMSAFSRHSRATRACASRTAGSTS